MVAPQLFDNDAQSASLSPPPAAPPPKKFRRGLLAAVAAVTIAGGAGSGALAATLVDHSTPTTTASTGTTTSSSTTSASTLHPVTLGNSDSAQVGDTVYAIGSPFGLSGSLSQGIISNLKQSGRTSNGSNLSGLIQTDAAINPGNSGGALVNTQGEVIGINSSIESPVDGNVGVGFAIPIN